VTAHHWHVLGAGAMGCLFAARLQDSGCDITLVVRDTRPDPVALVLEDGEDAREMKFPTTTAADRAPISHLLVTTKAYDVVDAVSSLAHRLDRDSQVLLLANGLGFASELSGRYPWLAPYCGTTTEGAYRVSSFRIRHAGHGATRIGRSGEPNPPAWFAPWRALENCLWEQDIDSALWEKLAVNCAINPLTAVHDCRNGELLSRPELAREVDALCNEIARVSEAAEFAPIAAGLRARVEEVIRNTASNHSSMLQDCRAGRTTEIDYITGQLLRVADLHGIAAPRNRSLLEQVKRLGG
jgi:2-dehydropantoate 2-reductase